MRNCFDPQSPADTNLFLARTKDVLINGNALLATNRELRQDTLDVVDSAVRKCKVPVPYVLDIMVVPNVGVFPTWMSYPCRPDRIDQLQINVRVVRPDKGLVPRDWTYPGDSRRRSTLSWNVITAILLYATGRLSLSPLQQPPDGMSSDGQPGTALASVVEARLTAAPRFVVDRVFINWHTFEYSADGARLALDPGHAQRERDKAFCDEIGIYHPPVHNYFWKHDYLDGCERSRSLGSYIESTLCRLLKYHRRHNNMPNLYHCALATSIGSLCLWESDGDGQWRFGRRILEKGRAWRFDKEHWFPDDGDVAAALAAAQAEWLPDQVVVYYLKQAQWRMKMGWWGAKWEIKRAESEAAMRNYELVFLPPMDHGLDWSDDDSG